VRSTKQLNNKLEKSANYMQFDWVDFMSKEYFDVVEAINDCYKKMLEIGKCKEVFGRVDGNQCELLMAKSKKDFCQEKHTVALQLLRGLWCTKIDYIHRC